MKKLKWWPIIAFAISLVFNIYQLIDSHNNSKKFSEFKKENKEYQTKLENNQSKLSQENQQLLSAVNEQGEMLRQYNLSKEDQQKANDILKKAKELSPNILQNGCRSDYPKPKIAGGCFEKPCNWIASANEKKIKDSQYGAVYLNDGSFAYVQRCGNIIHAIEKDKRGNPPTLKQLNEFRIPKPLVGTCLFKQVSPNVWVFEKITK